MTRKMARVGIVVAAVACLGWLGAGPAGAGGGGHCDDPLAEGSGTAVEMRDACFTPAVLHVGVGERITFTNADPIPHDVSPAGWGWGHPGELPGGGSFTASFPEDGVYPYACSLHPGMTGTVIVGDAADPSGELAMAAGPADEPPSDGVSAWWVAIAGAVGLAGGSAIARTRRAPQPNQPVPGA